MVLYYDIIDGRLNQSFYLVLVQGERESPLDLAASRLLGHGLGSALLERLAGSSRPVVLGLCHSVSEVDILGPGLLGVSSTLGVPVGVVLEDSCLGNVSSVVLGLLLFLSLADVIVLGSGQTRRNVRFSLLDLTEFQVLLISCSVGVLVLLRGEEIHIRDSIEEGCLELSSNSSLGNGGESLDSGNKDEGEDNGVRLHGSGLI